MRGTAIYRLPYSGICTLIEGNVSEMASCAGLNGRRGFVVAPFEVTAQQPILLISPDRVKSMEPADVDDASLSISHTPLATDSNSQSPESYPLSTLHLHYSIDFANFHAQLQEGVFDKIVLARCVAEPNDGQQTPVQLFRKACQLYPRLFVALVTTPQSGTWLTATPEILLEGSGTAWRTVALAGTMRLEGEQLAFDTPPSPDGKQMGDVRWSTKNIQEQRIVATYVIECLEQFLTRLGGGAGCSGDFREEGPRTVRAANLVHLRSDFTFTLPDTSRLGDLLQALHPTPAVCGLPKREAFRFIVQNEHTPRRYYSGFMGPLDMEQPTAVADSPIAGANSPTAVADSPTAGAAFPQTHLYVSLRCMSLARDTYYLYAGGGLMKDSNEEQEWQETEAKLETMRSLLSLSHSS